ncbi:hypothetical protein [Rhizobium leguminosarum]|uniref:hypothetical protein n=1 Tax=Rhizobium leguminosarum TaxID=384 RepID=UPI003F97AD7D
MIKIEVVIPPFRLAGLREILGEKYGQSLVVTQVQRTDAWGKGTFRCRGVEQSQEFAQRLKVEIWADVESEREIAASMRAFLSAAARYTETSITKSRVERCIVIGD